MRGQHTDLGFVFEYWEEMHRLYYLTNGYDPDNGIHYKIDKFTYDQIAMVAEKADQQAESLLKDCDRIIEQHIIPLCSCRVLSRAKTDRWKCELPVWPNLTPNPGQDYRASVGFNLGANNPNFRAWIWSQGGADREDELYTIIADSGKFPRLTRGKSLRWKGCNLILDTWPLSQEIHQYWTLNFSALLKKCTEPFLKLDHEIMDEILSIYPEYI